MCTKYDNHYRLHGQHNWADLYDHLLTTRIFTFIMRSVGMDSIWICKPSHTYHVFHILGVVGWSERVAIQG